MELRLGPANPNPVRDNKSVLCPRLLSTNHFVTMLIADFVRGRPVLDNGTLLRQIINPKL